MERSAAPIELRCVSFHAVTRYVQRVLGTMVPGEERLGGSEAFAIRHAAAVGMTVDQVREAILLPEVRLGLQLGAVAVRSREFKAIINPEQRVVVTIEFRVASPGYEPRPLREMTRSEGRRAGHRNARRDRHRFKPMVSA